MDIGIVGMILMFGVGLIAGLAIGRGAHWKQRSEDAPSAMTATCEPHYSGWDIKELWMHIHSLEYHFGIRPDERVGDVIFFSKRKKTKEESH